MKIFICEQDQSKAKSMQAILGHYSYKVITVQKNTDLFKQASQQHPALIIVNESFNENSSIETINRLRNDPETSDIPVIYIGHDNEGISNLYPQNDTFFEFVQEPVKIKNLKHYIDRWTTFRSINIKH
jgi:response regulator RpfG family c-di-GMP phosphodiesterase